MDSSWGCSCPSTCPRRGHCTALQQLVAKGRCRRWCSQWRTAARYAEWQAKGVEFTQEPVERYGAIDAGFRDPSGNGWKMIEARSEARRRP